MNERGEIEIGSAVKVKFIVNELVGGISFNAVAGDIEFWDIFFATISTGIWHHQIVLWRLQMLISTGLTGSREDFIRVNVLS